MASSSHQTETGESSAVALEPSHYCDDEPLRIPKLHLSLFDELPKVRVSGIPESTEVTATLNPISFAVLMRIKAPSMLEYRRFPLKRGRVDLVMVLDISESNDAELLYQVKKSAEFIIDSMDARDRLSIVLSWPNATRVLPLRLMTPDRKQEANQTVSTLFFADGPTNIAQALIKGARVLMERRYRNPVASLIVLSNSRYSCRTQPQTSTDQRQTAGYLHLLPDSIYPRDRERNAREKKRWFPVHAFGIGQNHDPTALHALSSASGGTYSYIESLESLEDAIASCIGGLFSVVAEEFTLMMIRGYAVKFQAINSGQFFSGIFDSGTVGEIKVGSLYAGEVKEFLIYVSLPELNWKDWGRKTCISLVWFYDDVVSNKPDQLHCDILDICRPIFPPVESDEQPEAVRRQKTRVFGAGSIEEAHQIARRGDVSAARKFLVARLGRICNNEFMENNDGLCLWLYAEMCEIARRMAGDEHVYREFGQGYALANVSSHGSQRATAIGPRVPDQGLGYGTHNIRNMVRMTRLIRLVSASHRQSSDGSSDDQESA